MRELIQELERNEGDLISEVELLADEKCSFELKHQAKIREVEEINLLFDEKSNQCQNFKSENSLLVEKIKLFEAKEKDWKE